jgi:hypothetical protein
VSTWLEIVVAGSESTLRAFLAGFEAGTGVRLGSVLGDDVGIEHGSLSERVRDLFPPGSHHILIAPVKVADALTGAIESKGGELHLTIASVRPIASASLAFTVEAYNQTVTTQVRQIMFAQLPPGVSTVDLKESEERHPEDEGAELYAPVHAYTYRATGAFAGPLEGILEMHRRAVENEFVTPGHVKLVTREK